LTFVKYAPFFFGLFECLQRTETLERNLFDGFIFLFCGFVYAPETHHTPIRAWAARGCGFCRWGRYIVID
jgi:hypothetical protein